MYDDFDLDASWKKASASFITLADGAIRFDGAGATTSGDKVTITEAGTYVVSGKATDAQIVVDLNEKGLVKLVLDGVDLTRAESAPIYVKRADRTVLVLAEGSENFIADGSSYVLDDAGAGPGVVTPGGAAPTPASPLPSASSNAGSSAATSVPSSAATSVPSSAGTSVPSSASSSTSSSAKGLKAGGSVFVEGVVVVNDSADDGLHADALVKIAEGTINIASSCEGIEAAVVTLAGGDIHIVASDDGINVAGGDGIDCNGRVFMTGGTVVVHGPVEDMNGALDYLGEFTVSGGFVVAAGSVGMAEAANTLVHGESEKGKEILKADAARRTRGKAGGNQSHDYEQRHHDYGQRHHY